MNLSRISTLISPSLISGFTTIILSVLVLAGATFSYFSGSGIIYDYIFGPNSSVELIQSSRSSIDALTNTVFGNPLLNKILYFIFWMLVGLLVYILLFIIFRSSTMAAEDIQEITQSGSRFEQVMEHIGARLATRAIALLLWGLYWVFFVKTLLPFSVLSAKIGVASLPSVNGWLFGVLGIVVLAISIHIHVVFLRLIALRVRLIDTTETTS